MDLATYRQKLLSGHFDFDEMAHDLWRYQLAHNPVMRRFAGGLERPLDSPISMPIAFFKHFELQTSAPWEPETIFESSGTTGSTPSRHLVRDLKLYEENTLLGFRHFFPEPRYRVLALLPSYLERGSSSLVHMAKVWMETFGLPNSGFFLHDFQALHHSLTDAQQAGEPILLIGVAYALLDFVEAFPMPLPADSIIIETGGMKGRKEEMVRHQLHDHLKKGFGVPVIRSEYGMTELMSQAYTVEEGRFRAAPTLRVRVSDLHLDRLDQPPGVTGRIHLIDLANVHSCGFIATDDLGRWYEDGTFEVLGRIDTAEMRGCSLMYS